MSDLSSNEIVAWHRKEAKKYQDLAYFHKKTADTLEFPEGLSRQPRQEIKPREVGELTLEQFEKAVAEKGGRVNHIAARIQASEESIWNLLKDPACKYVVGDRGFIYLKQ